MTNRLKNSLLAWTLYSIGCYVIMLPYKQWILAAPVAVIVGFLFSMINSILVELYKLNDRKSPNSDKLNS